MTTTTFIITLGGVAASIALVLFLWGERNFQHKLTQEEARTMPNWLAVPKSDGSEHQPTLAPLTIEFEGCYAMRTHDPNGIIYVFWMAEDGGVVRVRVTPAELGDIETRHEFELVVINKLQRALYPDDDHHHHQVVEPIKLSSS